MSAIHISLTHIQIFFFIFLRTGAILMTLPLFDNKAIPLVCKVGLSFSFSIILYRIVKIDDIPFVADVAPFALGVISEIALGIIIGLSVKLIFSAIQMAGEMAGIQMAFGMARVLDPQTGAQVSVIAQYEYLIGMLIFLALDAHHLLLRAMVDSFHLVPVLDFRINHALIGQLVHLAGNMFVISVKIGAPVITALLLTSVALGLVARTVPQMNVFIVAFPVKIIVGLFFFGFTLPYLLALLKQLFYVWTTDILMLLKTVGPAGGI